MNVRGQWIWVTGASSGLGEELAKQLAAQGANLLLTARRAERLEALKAALSNVEVRVLPADMSNQRDVERALEEVKKLPVVAVVLNAGATHLGRHEELEWATFEKMLQLNVMGTTRVTTELVKHYQAQKVPLRIMMVTSMAGLMPVPFQAAYSGTKAFLTAFGTALAHELRGTSHDISVTVFAPGGIATEMTAGDNFGTLRGWLAPVGDVAREALHALATRPPLYVQGFTNRMGLFFFRFLPRNLVMGQLRSQYAKSLAAAAAARKS